jgi:cytochrome P450
LPKDPLGFCLKAALAGEGLVRLDVGPMKIYVVSHPDYMRHILVTNAGNYNKGSVMDGIRVALGNGLFTSDGELWRRQRRLMQPAFDQRHIEHMVDTIIAEELSGAIQRWAPAIESGTAIDILEESIQLNIRITLRTLFGATIDSAKAAQLLRAADAVFQGMTRRVWTFFVPSWLPTPGGAKYRQSIRALDEHVYDIIASQRASLEQQDDLLSMLLSARDEETLESMSDQQIRDEIFTFFVAGYESTASNIAWTCYLLSTHPAAGQALRAELDSTLGDRAPVYADLPALAFTRMVIKEALRLYPAFPMYFRTAIDADTVGPYSLPAGASVVLNPYTMHHDPRYWADPEVFDPDRFSAERFGAYERNAYYPFGRGQRMCIGESMALTTAQMVVATIAQNFETELPAGSVVTGHYAMTYTPKNGLPLTFRRRARGVKTGPAGT